MCCEIVLQNYDGSYHPGDTIKGTVVCTPENSGQQQDIHVQLRLQGKESTGWCQTRQWLNTLWRDPDEMNATYRGVTMFYSDTLDFSHNDGLISDRYEIPFNATLPSDLPGSYSGNNGAVEFSIEADVNYSNSRGTKHKILINLVSPLDFSNSPLRNCDILRHYDETESTFDWFCRGASATMEVYLDKLVYEVGDFIRVHMIIENGLKTAIPQVQVDLTTTIEERATLPEYCSKYYIERLNYKTCKGVKSRSRRVYGFDLRIPDTTVVHNFNGCNLFKQLFTVKIRAWCAPSQIMETNCKIFVGSKSTSTSPSNVEPQYLLSQNDFINLSDPDDETRVNHASFRESLGFNVRSVENAPPSYDETMRHSSVYLLRNLRS